MSLMETLPHDLACLRSVWAMCARRWEGEWAALWSRDGRCLDFVQTNTESRSQPCQPPPRAKTQCLVQQPSSSPGTAVTADNTASR